MNEIKTTKKGFFALIRESLTKTGGCCGAGQTCGGASAPTKPKATTPEPAKPVGTKPK